MGVQEKDHMIVGIEVYTFEYFTGCDL
jgi:hypothetical protein